MEKRKTIKKKLSGKNFFFFFFLCIMYLGGVGNVAENFDDKRDGNRSKGAIIFFHNLSSPCLNNPPPQILQVIRDVLNLSELNKF